MVRTNPHAFCNSAVSVCMFYFNPCFREHLSLKWRLKSEATRFSIRQTTQYIHEQDTPTKCSTPHRFVQLKRGLHHIQRTSSLQLW
ncbi:hypothetical protein K443DRAFT_189986 [Laccaria amethystina LaAM-08-1]|uniref:Unplaced genomic scaffold K443scaffold_121, whole genome shotgun sequence n=1 Tax=Laccaria amethystina LaAM-08-1 TaxID=1095629 RepID=A0A0C9XC16_9AGAR|nr:hypothetical protein K443DRAFT_189986 [Laccaria amethystina LaAM-08-1]